MKPVHPDVGSWTRYSGQLSCLEPALRELCQRVERKGRAQAERAATCRAEPHIGAEARVPLDASDSATSCSKLLQLSSRLRLLLTAELDTDALESAVSLCLAHDYYHTEGFLSFLYTVTFQPLTEATARLLRRLQSREDVELVAVELVNTLFVELTEALLDHEDPFTSPRLPPPGRTLPWLFHALRNDALDHCKSGVNRLEQSLVPAPHEDYEHAMDRVSTAKQRSPELSGLRCLELLERSDAFVSAFERATAQLKPRHQQVLFLREVECLGIEGIAEKLAVTPQQVQDLLQYGREKRARVLMLVLKGHPATADLKDREAEMLVLLKRVRLGTLSKRLQEWGRRETAPPMASHYSRSGPEHGLYMER